ncbi:MAG TPA: aldehyde oxidase [Kiritimatiellae bacterium]|nr:aldehyde oxidase [Kiritimatiellia bacterium]
MVTVTRRGYVGLPVERTDAIEKVQGKARYVGDVRRPNMWYGAIVRSPVSHGFVEGLERDPHFDWSGVVLVTPDDIPGSNVVESLVRDMPFLAAKEVRYRGEPVALVAAPTREAAHAAAAAVKPRIRRVPALTEPDEVVRVFKAGGELEYLWSQEIRKGDAEQGLREARIVVEREYRTGYAEQLYIEPQGMIAVPQEDGGVLVEGSMQCPYYVQPELCALLNLPPEKVRVRQTVVGGGFGGKEEFPSLLAGYCALLALKSGRAVKIVFDREEDILFTTKRHPSWVRHRTGLTREGRITGWRVDFLLIGGAYATLSPVVLARGIIHAAIGYRCDDVVVQGRVVRTNMPPSGAFRGFGAPQAFWALESHVDELAEACGMRPDEFRLRNIYRGGDTTTTGQRVPEQYGGPAVLRKALELSRFGARYAHCSRGRTMSDRWYGIGLAYFCHGAGFTGDGEARIRARAAVELARGPEGGPAVVIRASSTEMGQGAQTVLRQIVADALAVPIDRVRYPLPDTALVPDSGPTVASRTTMVVGAVLYDAAVAMKKALQRFVSRNFFDGEGCVLEEGTFSSETGRSLDFTRAALDYLRTTGVQQRFEAVFSLPPGTQWDQERFRGDAYPDYSWACYVAEVEVERATLAIGPIKITAVLDIGRVVNPVLAEGQVQGGLVQGIGYALMEKVGVAEGLFEAARMQTYIVPGALDIPEIRVTFVECPYPYSATGAKGLGELPLNGAAPAVGNALKHAVGRRIHDLPVTPEKLFRAIERKGDAP